MTLVWLRKSLNSLPNGGLDTDFAGVTLFWGGGCAFPLWWTCSSHSPQRWAERDSFRLWEERRDSWEILSIKRISSWSLLPPLSPFPLHSHWSGKMGTSSLKTSERVACRIRTIYRNVAWPHAQSCCLSLAMHSGPLAATLGLFSWNFSSQPSRWAAVSGWIFPFSLAVGDWDYLYSQDCRSCARVPTHPLLWPNWDIYIKEPFSIRVLFSFCSWVIDLWKKIWSVFSKKHTTSSPFLTLKYCN